MYLFISTTYLDAWCKSIPRRHPTGSKGLQSRRTGIVLPHKVVIRQPDTPISILSPDGSRLLAFTDVKVVAPIHRATKKIYLYPIGAGSGEGKGGQFSLSSKKIPRMQYRCGLFHARRVRVRAFTRLLLPCPGGRLRAASLVLRVCSGLGCGP